MDLEPENSKDLRNASSQSQDKFDKLTELLTRSLKVGSHDPFFGSSYFSVIVSAHRNVDSHHYFFECEQQLAQKLDRVNPGV